MDTENKNLTEIEQKKLEIHLSEYNFIRSEVSNQESAYYRSSSIYVTAILIIIGWFLKPDSKGNLLSLKQIIEKIEVSNFYLSLILVITTINILIVFRGIGHLKTIFIMSKYSTYYLAEKINDILGDINKEVIYFDKWDTIVGDKKSWLFTRTIAASVWFTFAISINLFLLIYFSRYISGNIYLVVYYIINVGLTSLSIGLLIHFIKLIQKYHEYDVAVTEVPFHDVAWLVIPMLVSSTIMIIPLICSG